MPYVKVMTYDSTEKMWMGYFQEMQWAVTQAEFPTLENCSLWLDYLLEDLQAWAAKGVIKPLPQPFYPDNEVHMIIDFDNPDFTFPEYPFTHPFPSVTVNTVYMTVDCGKRE